MEHISTNMIIDPLTKALAPKISAEHICKIGFPDV